MSVLTRCVLPSASRFFNAYIRERFPRSYKKCFVLLSNPRGISQSTPLEGPMSSLTHYLVPSFDTICNSPSPLLVDIVCFDPLHITVNLTVLKRIVRGFHTLIWNVLFFSPTDMGSHNPHHQGSNVLAGTLLGA